MLVQIALDAHGGQFPCFSGGADAVLSGLEQRFRPDLTSKRVRAAQALFSFGVCVSRTEKIELRVCVCVGSRAGGGTIRERGADQPFDRQLADPLV